MAQYEVLYKGRPHCDLEVRKYPPIKRTITVANRQYFLQFPPMLFAKLGDNQNCTFYAAFCGDDGQVYPVPLGGCGMNFSICLDMKHHFHFPAHTALETIIRIFWQTDFHDLSQRIFNGRLHNWGKNSLDQVLEEIKKLQKAQMAVRRTSSGRSLVKYVKDEGDFIQYLLNVGKDSSLGL